MDATHGSHLPAKPQASATLRRGNDHWCKAVRHGAALRRNYTQTVNPLKLYVDARATSPYALSVYAALAEKGLAFTLEFVDLSANAQHGAGYADVSLTERVPTLVDGDFALSESSAITEYLEEKYPTPPVYPRGGRDLARCRQVQAWIRSDLMPIREERSTEYLFYTHPVAPLSDAGQRAKDKLVSTATRLLTDGSGSVRTTLFEDWCLADLDLAVMLMRLVKHNDPVPEALAAYARRHFAHPAVLAWIGLVRRDATVP